MSRRLALLAGASALLLSAAGCGAEPPDPKAERQLASLRDQSGRARLESAQARLLAERDPIHAAALHEAADVRRAHAEALDAQLARLDQSKATTATSGAPANIPAPASLAEFRASLAESQRLAADSARDFSGYQAGLTASVAAAVGALLAVVLVEEAQ